MSWKIAVLVALLTGVITAIVTAPVADRMTKLHGVSDFEGGRGMTVAFFFIPAGLIGGMLLGLLVTRSMHATAWVHLWKAAGLSILLGQVALFGIAGISLLSIPRPPKIAGQTLALEIEVHVPIDRMTPDARRADQIRVSLYAGPKDNAYATIDRTNFREDNGKLVIPAKASLKSRSYTRTISFHIQEHTWLVFDPPLDGMPKTADFQWSDLHPMREVNVAGGSAAPTDVMLRYRVVKEPVH